MEHLTKSQIQECRYYFDLLDKSGSGKLGLKEMGTIMKSLGFNVPENELKDLISEVNSSENSEIDFADFTTLLCRKMKDLDTEGEIDKLFKELDKNGKGYLTLDDLKFLKETVGEKYTSDELYEMLAEADVDHDGVLRYDDFAKMMLSQ